MACLCVLSRSRISELSKAELSLQKMEWLFQLLSHQFSLQEMGLRLCHELPPAQGCGKTLGWRRTWWLLSAPTVLCLCVHCLPWVLCAGLFLAVDVQGCPVLPCTCTRGDFPASTGCGSWGGAGLQLGHLQVEITLVISVPLCLSCSHPWSSVCELVWLKGN